MSPLIHDTLKKKKRITSLKNQHQNCSICRLFEAGFIYNARWSWSLSHFCHIQTHTHTLETCSHQSQSNGTDFSFSLALSVWTPERYFVCFFLLHNRCDLLNIWTMQILCTSLSLFFFVVCVFAIFCTLNHYLLLVIVIRFHGSLFICFDLTYFTLILLLLLLLSTRTHTHAHSYIHGLQDLGEKWGRLPARVMYIYLFI